MPATLAVALTGADQIIANPSAGQGPSLYAGFSVRETAGSTAVLRIHNGTSAAGTLLDSVSLAAGESAREFYSPPIWASLGVFVDVISGSIEGSVRVA